MLAALVATQAAYDILDNLPEFASAGITTYALSAVPLAQVVPAALVYAEKSDYSAAIGYLSPAGDINASRVVMVVRILVAGQSIDPILGAHKAQLAALHGAAIDHNFDGTPYLAAFTATQEWPTTDLLLGSASFRQLGTRYTVDVTKGG